MLILLNVLGTQQLPIFAVAEMSGITLRDGALSDAEMTRLINLKSYVYVYTTAEVLDGAVPYKGKSENKVAIQWERVAAAASAVGAVEFVQADGTIVWNDGTGEPVAAATAHTEPVIPVNAWAISPGRNGIDWTSGFKCVTWSDGKHYASAVIGSSVVTVCEDTCADCESSLLDAIEESTGITIIAATVPAVEVVPAFVKKAKPPVVTLNVVECGDRKTLQFRLGTVNRSFNWRTDIGIDGVIKEMVFYRKDQGLDFTFRIEVWPNAATALDRLGKDGVSLKVIRYVEAQQQAALAEMVDVVPAKKPVSRLTFPVLKRYEELGMYDGVGIKGKTEAFAKILAQRSDTKTYVNARMSKGQFDHILDMSDVEGIDAVKRMIEMSSAEYIKDFNCFLDGYDNMSIAAESVYAYIVGKSCHSFIKACIAGKKINVADYGISDNGVKRLLALCQAPFDIASVMTLKDGFWVPYAEITSVLKANIKTLFSEDNGVYNPFKIVQKPEWLIENTVVEWLLYCGMTNNLAFTVSKPLFTGFNEDNYDKVVEIKEAYQLKLNSQSAAIWKEVKYLAKKRNQEKAAAEAVAKQKELLSDFEKW